MKKLRDVQQEREGAIQGGIFSGEPGSRPTKFLQQFTLFWREFDFKVYQYFLSNEGFLPITHNMQEILSQEEISCHRKKLLVTGTNFMPLLKISCHKGSNRIKKCHKKWKKSTRGGGQKKTSKSPKFEIWTF